MKNNTGNQHWVWCLNIWVFCLCTISHNLCDLCTTAIIKHYDVLCSRKEDISGKTCTKSQFTTWTTETFSSLKRNRRTCLATTRITFYTILLNWKCTCEKLQSNVRYLHVNACNSHKIISKVTWITSRSKIHFTKIANFLKHAIKIHIKSLPLRSPSCHEDTSTTYNEFCF